MQAVLPFGFIAILGLGLVLLALAFEPSDPNDRGHVELRPVPGSAPLVLDVVETDGRPTWLDFEVWTRDGFPVPHSYGDHDRDDVVDVGETMTLAGAVERHDGTRIVHNGETVLVIKEVSPDGPQTR